MSDFKFTYGVGINDADYVTSKRNYLGAGREPSGRKQRTTVWECPYYRKWTGMLRRCYYKACQDKQPTYIGCSVCEEWLTFSNFRKWMITQDWQGNELDKDLLIQGNKIYSPTTCVFVDLKVNNFTKINMNYRGDLLLGVSIHSQVKKFAATCNNPFKKDGDTRTNYLGLYLSETSAHLAWKKRKHQYACELAESKYVTDGRVRQVLLTKYKNYMVVEDHLK